MMPDTPLQMFNQFACGFKFSRFLAIIAFCSIGLGIGLWFSVGFKLMLFIGSASFFTIITKHCLFVGFHKDLESFLFY